MRNRFLAFSLVVLTVRLFSFCQAQDLSPIEKGYLENAYRRDLNGWIYLHIEGKPFERGFQRGFLTAKEIFDFKETVAHTAKFNTARDFDFFVKKAVELFQGKVSDEYVEEMQGIASGMRKAGKQITYEEILYLNGSIDIDYWWSLEKEKESKPGGGCSAFIATGKSTKDGKIIMAHNSWWSYVNASYFNLIVDIVPEKGYRILMQSLGPCIYSASDFFITGAGLVGTETTIGYFKGFDSKGTPVFERARKAMQYAGTIDEWTAIMINDNNGAYANSWLIGDINTNEIARLELGLKHHSLEKKKDGYFTGSNMTDNIEILRDEAEAAYDDIRAFGVARRVRWKQLMKQNEGEIDAELAKKFLADHYDTYLEKEQPDTRTICGHMDLDNASTSGDQPFVPAGAFDGKVVSSEMAKNWQFWAKWGHPCGIDFNAKEFLEKHPQYDWLEGYLKDLKANPWTIFPPERKR